MEHKGWNGGEIFIFSDRLERGSESRLPLLFGLCQPAEFRDFRSNPFDLRAVVNDPVIVETSARCLVLDLGNGEFLLELVYGH